MTAFYVSSQLEFNGAEEMLRHHHKLIHAGPSRGAVGDLVPSVGETLADTLARSAKQELKRSLEAYFAVDDVPVDDVTTFRFLNNHFSPERRTARIYPWLLAFLPEPHPTSDEIKAAGAMLEARINALDPAALDLARMTDHEKQMMPLFEAAVARDDAERPTKLFEQTGGVKSQD